MKKDVHVFLWWDTESSEYMSRMIHLSNSIVLYLAFEKPPHWFPQLLHQFTPRQYWINTEKDLLCQSLFSTTLRTAILKTAVKWSLQVALVCTVLMLTILRSFKNIYGPFVSLLLRTVCLVHWPHYWLAWLIHSFRLLCMCTSPLYILVA